MQWRLDAQALRCPQHAIDSNLLGKPDRNRVSGFRERFAQRDYALELPIVI